VAQLAACEAEKTQLKQQLAEAADQAGMLRHKVAEQEGHMGAARVSLQEQLRELQQRAKGKAEVSYATRWTARLLARRGGCSLQWLQLWLHMCSCCADIRQVQTLQHAVCLDHPSLCLPARD
jgi:hypothetical protein